MKILAFTLSIVAALALTYMGWPSNKQTGKETAHQESALVIDKPFDILIQLPPQDVADLRALEIESLNKMKAWRAASGIEANAKAAIADRYNLEYTYTTGCAVFYSHPSCAWYRFTDDHKSIEATWQKPPYRRVAEGGKK